MLMPFVLIWLTIIVTSAALRVLKPSWQSLTQSCSSSRKVSSHMYTQTRLNMLDSSSRAAPLDLAHQGSGSSGHEISESAQLEDSTAHNDDTMSSTSDRTLILSIITRIAESYLQNKSFDDIDPTIFTENAHILCRGRLYEDVISNLIASAKSEQASQHLQRIDALIRGFLSSERKSRSRLKVNYLLAAASEELFDDAIEALSASDEIDDDLQSFVRQLIKKEEERFNGLAPIVNDRNELVFEPQKFSPSDRRQESPALSVLKLIYKRVKAEMLTKSDTNIKLLHTLLRCKPDERLTLLQQQLRRIELIMNFAEYVEDALAFVEAHDGRGMQGGEQVQLAAGTVEVLRDVLHDIRDFQRQLSPSRDEDTVYENGSD